MSRLLVIGCGGVAQVAIQKCAQNSKVFTEMCLASRTVSKCDALKEKLEKQGTPVKITTATVKQVTNEEILAQAKKDFPYSKALHDDGIMVYQHGSPFYDEDEESCRAMHRKAYRVFPVNRVYQAHIPTCPAGYWLFGFASKKYHPLKDFNPDRWDERGIKTWYYTTHLHKGAFMLPKYVEDLLQEEEDMSR